MVSNLKFKKKIIIWLRDNKIRYKNLMWFIPRVYYLFNYKNNIKKRILIVYDTSIQPLSIGDILVTQELSLILKNNKNVDYIDFALIFNSENFENSDNNFKSINSENIIFNITSLTPVIQINQFLGSIFQFNSQSQLFDFISHSDYYDEIWPKLSDIAFNKKYMYYDALNAINIYFNKNKEIPKIKSRNFLSKWAKYFLTTNSQNDLPVTINIRNNNEYQQERNSNIDVWLKFFKEAKYRFKIKFFIICSKSEVDNRLRNHDNVVIVKDFQTTVEQDLAIISESAMHLGTSSGPASLAWFIDTPFLIFNSTLNSEYFSDNNIIRFFKNDIFNFNFSNSRQLFTSKKESVEMLLNFLNEYYEYINDSYRKNNNELDKQININNWLR